MTETSFESSFLNLKFDLPEGFTMATEEQMQQMVNAGAGAMDLNDNQIDYAMQNTVYEMMAFGAAGVPSVTVIEEKLPMDNFTVEQYLANVVLTLQAVDQMAYEIDEDYKTVSIAGQDYSSFTAKCDVNGLTMTQEYYALKVGGRMASIVVTYTDTTTAEKEALMKGFSALA